MKTLIPLSTLIGVMGVLRRIADAKEVPFDLQCAACREIGRLSYYVDEAAQAISVEIAEAS